MNLTWARREAKGHEEDAVKPTYVELHEATDPMTPFEERWFVRKDDAESEEEELEEEESDATKL